MEDTLLTLCVWIACGCLGFFIGSVGSHAKVSLSLVLVTSIVLSATLVKVWL